MTVPIDILRRAGLGRADLALWLGALLLVVGLAAAGDGLRSALRYERAAVLAGEYWRLASDHLVHLGWRHLGWNLIGLTLMWWLWGGLLTFARWGAVLLASGLAMAAGFLLLEPDLQWYVGLSGLLHGVAVAGGLIWALARRVEGYLLLALLVAKIAWEQLAGPTPQLEQAVGGPVAVDAHLYGAFGGLLALLPGGRRAGSDPL